MQGSGKSKGKSFTVFRSAAEEADAKRDAMKREEQTWDNEGGHMSSNAGRVVHVSGAELPYVVILTHHGSEATEHGFATIARGRSFHQAQYADPRRRSLRAVRSAGVQLLSIRRFAAA